MAKLRQVKKTEKTDDDYEGFRDLLSEYEPALSINKHDLDEALVMQPDAFYRVASSYALVLSRRDEAKLGVDRVRAQADQEVRADYEGEKKPPESQIASEVDMNVSVQEAEAEYLAWKGLVDRWDALRDAFKQRAYVLKDLVELHVTGYYSSQTGSSERKSASDRGYDKFRREKAEARGRD